MPAPFLNLDAWANGQVALTVSHEVEASRIVLPWPASSRQGEDRGQWKRDSRSNRDRRTDEDSWVIGTRSRTRQFDCPEANDRMTNGLQRPGRRFGTKSQRYFDGGFAFTTAGQPSFSEPGLNMMLELHRRRDVEKIPKALLPQGLEIRIEAIWVAEVYPPTLISHLYEDLERLDWNRDPNRLDGAAVTEFITRQRESTRGGGWLNLGLILRPTDHDSSADTAGPNFQPASIMPWEESISRQLRWPSLSSRSSLTRPKLGESMVL